MAENIEVVLPAATQVNKKRPLLIDILVRLFKEKPLGVFGLVIVIILLVTGIFAPLIAPFGENEVNLSIRLAPPSAEHWLGGDQVGRDLLTRIIYGARISMMVGVFGSFLDASIASVIGLISGFFGGKIDLTIQRFVDAFMCFPSLFFFLTIMALLGPGLLQVILVLGVAGGIRSSRVVRSAVISIKGNAYIDAAKAVGAPNATVIYRHVLPNVMAPILIVFTVAMGRMIISEATLSFLGFGVPPPTASWGSMLSGAGRQYMLEAPGLALWPGIALACAVYGINMLGDAIRDLVDPRLRGGIGRYSGVKGKILKRQRNTK